MEAPKEILPGYLWLKLEDCYLIQWEKLCLRRHFKNEGCSFLSSSKWREMLKDTISQFPGIKNATVKGYQEQEDLVDVSVENNGPALTIKVTAAQQQCCSYRLTRRQYFYADFTLGLHCIHWPKEANGKS